MAFPFRPPVHTLRQKILVAIGSGGLAALSPFGPFGCGASGIDNKPSPMVGNGQAGAAGSAAGTGASGGASGATGGAGSGTPTGGTMAVGGAMASGGMMATGGMGGMGSMTTCESRTPAREGCLTREQMEGKARFGCGQIAITPEPTDSEVAAKFNADGCLRKEMACNSCCNPASAEGLPQGDGSCCYTYCGTSCCGRPFVVNGEARVAGVVERRDWLDATIELALPDAFPLGLGARVAREWLDDARMEHASMASFARFTEELLAFGAPAALVRDARQAAIDEVAHTRACFALAARFGGVAYGPGVLDTGNALPAATLREAAHRAFVEGCVGETLAAACARAASEVTGDAEARRVLCVIADDEERHAVLAWRFVAWSLTQGDAAGARAIAADVRSVLANAVDAGPRSLDNEAGEDVIMRAALHHAGRLTERDRAAVMRAALREIVRPCADAMLAKHAPVQTLVLALN